MKPIGKNLSAEEGERTVTRTNASIISRPFLIFTVKKARSKEGTYIYIYTHRSLSEGESISEMERRGGGKMEEEFSVAY